jgi:integrase
VGAKLRLPSYLISTASGYYFRVIIPLDLRPIVGRSELRYSVRTGFIGEAKHRALSMAGFTQRLFQSLRKGSKMRELSDAEIQKLIGQYFRQVLEEDEASRVMEDSPLPDEVHEEELVNWHAVKGDIQKDLADCNYDGLAKTMTDRLLIENRLVLDQESYSYRKLSREMLKVHSRILDVMEKRERGDYSDESLIPPAALPMAPEEEPSEPLSKIIDLYAQEQVTARRWSEKSRDEILKSLAFLQEVIGDLPAKTIDHKAMREFKQTLLRLPANRNKIAIYRDKTIKELLEMEIDQTLSVATVNKTLDRVSTLFNWAVRNGFMDRNPASAMQLPEDKRADEYRETFTAEDLTKIFHSRLYLQGTPEKSYHFWLPILGLFTGARIEELCQLHLDDIHQQEGVWVIDINDKGEKKLKNKQSRRIVPLHPFLLDGLGFIRHVESLKAKGDDRLFPELTRQRDGYSARASKWFGLYKRSVCGITESSKTFHSFRHTFIDNLKQNREVDREVIKQLAGHGGDDITMDRYGKRADPNALLENGIMKLGFEVDLEHLAKDKAAKQG